MLICFEDSLIFLSSLINLLLLALSEGSKSKVVELCDVKVTQLGDTAHLSKDHRRPLLERSNLIHQSSLKGTIFDLDDSVSVNIDLIVEVFKLLNDLWLFVKLLLKLLN